MAIHRGHSSPVAVYGRRALVDNVAVVQTALLAESSPTLSH